MAKTRKYLVGTLLMFLILLGTMSIALASDGLKWETTNVYYHGNNLIVEGYFLNNSRTEVIDRVNWFTMRVYLKDHGRWHQQAFTRFDDISVHIRPGETKSHRFVIDNNQTRRFSEWRVGVHASYHYRNHHHDRNFEYHDE